MTTLRILLAVGERSDPENQSGRLSTKSGIPVNEMDTDEHMHSLVFFERHEALVVTSRADQKNGCLSAFTVLFGELSGHAEIAIVLDMLSPRSELLLFRYNVAVVLL